MLQTSTNGNAPSGTRPTFRKVTAKLAVVLIALLLLTACGFGSSDGPGTFDYSGTWGGALTDESNGAGTLLVTLHQAGHALSGTWHAVMAGDPARQDGGGWSGELFVGQERDLLEATLSPAVAGQCSYRVTLTRTNEGMSGGYAAVYGFVFLKATTHRLHPATRGCGFAPCLDNAC